MPFLTSTELQQRPTRIVSLVPSQTELLYDLGLDKEVIGITKFCIHPEKWFRSKQRVGGTKTVLIKTVNTLRPDLIIANKEENTKEQIELLAQQFPVWLTDVNNLEDALQMIADLGQLTYRVKEAASLKENIEKAFQHIKSTKAQIPAAYFIWKDPYMVAAEGTFIHDMLQRAGFVNMICGNGRYPEADIATLPETGCKVLLLSSEPYPFKEKHLLELKKDYPQVLPFLVDGELFSWYGSRLLKAPAYFKKLFEAISNDLRSKDASV